MESYYGSWKGRLCFEKEVVITQGKVEMVDLECFWEV